MTEQNNVSKKSKHRSFWKVVIPAICLAFILGKYFFATSIVEGESMQPTLDDGQKVVFNKLVYQWKKPKRGDVVIVHINSEYYIKRIIGLPNEIIEVQSGKLFIDGKEQNELYIEDHYEINGPSFQPVLLPDHMYFVMGDNREISKDSRNGLGLISENDILGRSDFVIHPFSEIKRIQ